MDVTVVDLGMGNVGSVANMVRKVGGTAALASEPDHLLGAERVILPGVGAFDEAMARLEARGFRRPLEEVRARGIPVLGICLGMQLLAGSSEEGVRGGLGWIAGAVRRLPAEGPSGPVKVPHMGWSELEVARPHAVLADLADDARFYFVHSYAFVPDDPADVLATASHGGVPFVAAVSRDNVVGAQFHPEKSHRHGMALLRGFLGGSA